MGLSQIKVLGASLHGYQSQVNQELQNLKGQAARHVLIIIIIIIIILINSNFNNNNNNNNNNSNNDNIIIIIY